MLKCIPSHVDLGAHYFIPNTATVPTVWITSQSPEGKAVLECLDKPVVGEVDVGGGREAILIHHVEQEEKKRTSRWNRGRVNGVT